MGAIEFIGAVGKAILVVLGLNPDDAGWFVEHPQRLGIAIAIAVLAGISSLLGDSVVLFFNRLRGWRFALTLLLNGVGLVLLYLVQAAVVYLAGPWLTGQQVGLPSVVTGVMLATAPLVFGFFVLIPYVGPAIAVILQVWGLVALWLILDVLYATDHWTALLITLIAWACMQVLSRAFAVPITWVGERIWRLISGQPAMITGSDLLSGHLFMPLQQRFEYPVPELDEELRGEASSGSAIAAERASRTDPEERAKRASRRVSGEESR